MAEPSSYDLIVIGAGPAGENGAATASFLGKKTAIIEKSLVGGTSANTGTLPSKTLRETALALSGLRARNLYGVDLSLRREATVSDFLYHERHVKENERNRVRANLSREHVELIRGTGSFVDPHTVRVTSPEGERLLRGERILIAIGSTPLRPAEFPFDHPRVHDSDQLLEIDRLPTSMAIIGAGVIGSEYACTFNALGCKTHIVDGRDVLLPFLDLEVSQALTSAIEKSGITFHWKERVVACTAPEAGDIQLTLSSGKVLAVDHVLVAAGRASCTEALNLEAAEITPAKRGLLSVDHHFRTTMDHIYAAGDVIGFPALASASMEQARIAVCHMFGVSYKSAMAPELPSGIYTIPEVGMVGETEGSLQGKSIEYIVGKANYSQNARGEIIGESDGFLKLLFRKSDLKLLGVHVIGEQATELVHVGVLGLLTGATAEHLNLACFNYPTLSDLYKTATYDALGQLLKSRSVAS